METKNSLEDMNANQRKVIERQVEDIKKLKNQISQLQMWERFAASLINNHIGETVTEVNLEKWLEESIKGDM